MKVLGICNLYSHADLGQLTQKRPVGSTSFLGRYAVMDFAMSSFTNSNIDAVGILIKQFPRSILQHVENFATWDLNSKIGSKYIMYNENAILNAQFNSDINNIKENVHVLRHDSYDYIVVQPGHVLCNIDFNQVLEEHIASRASITVIYTKVSKRKHLPKSCYTLLIDENKKLVSATKSKKPEVDEYIFMESYIINANVFEDLIFNKSRDFSTNTDLINLLFNVAFSYSNINTYYHKNYVRFFDSLDSYMDISLELLENDYSKQLFIKNWPIYTLSHNTPPTIYGEFSCVKNSFIANGAVINGKIQNSIISRNVKIEKGAEVKNSIILTDVHIGKNVVIENAVIDKKAKIMSECVVKGTKKAPTYISKNTKVSMNVVMLATECVPFIKVGGLADVIYSLSKNIVKESYDVSIFLPYYKQIKEQKGFSFTYIGSYSVNINKQDHLVTVYSTIVDGVTVYLLENDYYYGRNSVYGANDEVEQNAFFTQASLRVLQSEFKKVDIIHIHDYQFGFVPYLLKNGDYNYGCLKSTKVMLTIHNPVFHGEVKLKDLSNLYNLELSSRLKKFSKDEKLSLLKIGIIHSDKITTVSPTHKEEILGKNDPYKLRETLIKKGSNFTGILNGVDYDEFNPKNDNLISENYDILTAYKTKKNNKNILFNDLKMRNNNGLLYGFVARLTHQKGVDLIISSAKEILKNGHSLIIIGTGDEKYEKALKKLKKKFPDNFGLYIGYNNKKAHQVFASCEFFLMPSYYEPCGITQMISQRYGSIPIARNVGGLKDSICALNKENYENADGIVFKNFNAKSLLEAVKKSEDLYKYNENYLKVQYNAMVKDHSWSNSIKKYISIYKEMLEGEKYEL